jgi:hypothetical protein
MLVTTCTAQRLVRAKVARACGHFDTSSLNLMLKLNRIVPWLLTLTSFALIAPCQTDDQRPIQDDGTAEYKLPDLILKARTSHFDPSLGESAIPVLKEAFVEVEDRVTKENIANTLLLFGQKDDAYWSILYERAQEIVNSTAPNALVFDANGKRVRGAVSPDFLDWVQNNNLSKDEALREQLDCPGELALMVGIGDPRGLSMLRKGLSSPNYGIRAEAALGLALLKDKDSISPIIQAAKTAPSDFQWWIAESLLAFDDAAAHEAAEKLISDKTLLEEKKQLVKARGARGLLW